MPNTDYRAEAVKCVNQYVLPEMICQFEECGCNLDAQYKKYGATEYFFANIIEPGHIYEIGYPRCVCMKVQADKNVSVEILETALTGGSKCRFRVTIE